MSQKGFSLLEMVLVLILLAILTVSAAPTITEIVTNSNARVKEEYVTSIRSGLKIFWANAALENDGVGSYPDSLDSAIPDMCDTVSNQCFTEVLDSVTGDPNNNYIPWRKENDGEYVYVLGDEITFTYDSSTGDFEEQ